VRWPDAPEERPRLHRSLPGPLLSLAWSPDGATLAAAAPANGTEARVFLLDRQLEVQREGTVLVEPSGLAAFRERALAEVPIPEYSQVEKARATPAATTGLFAAVLVLGLALRRRAAP